MFCIRCGKENEDSAKFCNECGFDFRTLNREAMPKEEEPGQAEAPGKKEPVKAETLVVEKADDQVEEPKKKKGGFFRRFLLTVLLALAIFFVKGGGLTELMNELKPEPDYVPVFIEIPEPDSRYDIPIEGAADDEFRAVMELLISERDTMETPVFIEYEWKALSRFKGATFEHEYMSRLAPAYINLVEGQRGLFTITTQCRIYDEDLHYQAQDNKNTLIVYMMLYGELMPGRDDVCEHYMKMNHAYINEQEVVADLKAQLLNTEYKVDAARNVAYLTYTNHTEMTFGVTIDCTYEYPDSYDGKGGYKFDKWTFETIRPGQTVTVDLNNLDQGERVNIRMKWDFDSLYLDGEEIYKYYKQHR